MILEAFSSVLHIEKRRTGHSAVHILHAWLMNILSEAHPADMVSKVVHAEVELIHQKGNIAFRPKSETGNILLQSLYRYCDSYEHWQFSRWLHELKPHEFVLPQ